jgi:uncharacterized membrane protein YukC
MQENLKDILSNLSTDVDQETLLLYLQGQLSAEQQHEVEKKMMDSQFSNDALEGLQSFKDQQRLQILVDQLKKDLKQKTTRKIAYREKRKIKLDSWVIITIVLILVLVVISYFIIHKYTASL